MLDYTLCFKKGVKLTIFKFKLQIILTAYSPAILIYNQYKEHPKQLKKPPLF